MILKKKIYRLWQIVVGPQIQNFTFICFLLTCNKTSENVALKLKMKRNSKKYLFYYCLDQKPSRPCTLCYTVLCVLCATQDGDAGAVSSPFFQLCNVHAQWRPRQVGVYESESCKKNAGNTCNFVFYFNTLILNRSLQTFFPVCSLTHFEPIFATK